MPPAARIGDPTNHGGTIGPPRVNPQTVMRVLIGGKPAAVVGSQHACPNPPHALISGGNVILPSPPSTSVVLIGGVPAACVRDKTTCGAQIVMGAVNVLIGGPL
ncbi:PAAR domain-containing protein [Saccharopolyspora flava]|uniref:Zn-binding Pro-Ala-Ala-Arg (PAAR) domain-containing protein, incolved in TypeVI secretion n=1 Tax=Saccharopolyspora flava TaxID=95161 RepID=A0A1I6UC41_9PSEU|nr:PAAR domain-containing protein [Saccharopolyspora flava]SFS99005.1 Zn-binding Pro-Ala-Ala-Arg (PAAR) domain-containing protein, incolved in TypeVI secretion [Saccharopolyspora flava]